MSVDASMRPIGEIVQKVRSGETQAWRDIVNRLYPWAMRIARNRLPNEEPTDDAVQEAFLVAFTNLHTLRDPESFPAWLAAIVKSQCAQIVSKLHREVPVDWLDDHELLPKDEVRTPENELHAMRLFGHFDAAVRSLPEHLGVVSRQYYLMGLSTGEIAQATGMSESAVKKRVHKARRLLQEKLLCYRGEDVFRVGYMPISDHLLAMVTEHLFRDRKLSLVQRRYLSWSVLATDLRYGRLDAAFIMVPLAVHLFRSGVPLLHIMDVHHDGSSLAVSLQDRIQCLGLPGPHSTHRALLDRLSGKELDLTDLTTRFINPSYALASMRSNKIDSFFCAEPWGTRCMHEKLGRILFRSKDIMPGHTCCILAVRAEYALKRCDVVRDYVSLLLRARDRTCTDPSFAAEVQSLFTGIPIDTARQVLEQRVVTFDDLKPDKHRVMEMTRSTRTEPDGATTFDLDRFVCTDFF